MSNAAKPRGSIFTNDRKVLLFSIREAKVVRNQRGQDFEVPSSRRFGKYYFPLFVNHRAPHSPPNAVLPKQKYHTQTPFRRRTERCARQSLPNLILRLPSSCSRALAERANAEAKRYGAATTHKVSLRRSLLSAERRLDIGFALATPRLRPRRGQKQAVRTARLCRP